MVTLKKCSTYQKKLIIICIVIVIYTCILITLHCNVNFDISCMQDKTRR